MYLYIHIYISLYIYIHIHIVPLQERLQRLQMDAKRPRDEKIWSLQAQKNLMKKMGPVFYIKVCPEWVTGKRQGGSKRKLSGVLGTRLPRYCWTTDERVAVRVPKTSLWEQKGPRRGFHPIEKPEVQKWVLNFWLPMQCDLAPHIWSFMKIH